MKKRILLCASYSVIEPLGLLHLGGLARDEGWDRKYTLVKDHDFNRFYGDVKDFKPDVVGFNVYTGNHIQLHEAFSRLKKDYPGITTIVGGPHPTYFPAESSQFADYVVMSEGFNALRRILKGSVEKGILPMQGTERFPHPDRKRFYSEYQEHGKSRIKSFISMTGCPYKCTYCYNSSEPEDIDASQEIIQQVKRGLSLSMLGKETRVTKSIRLFPYNVRSVDDVIKEAKEIAENWPTEVLYCQDDVHGFDLNNWMPKLAERWKSEVGIPYHAQMRWEMTKDERRLDLMKKAGCFGLTLAIEAADYAIRSEVLDRAMPEEVMFKGMKAVIDRGFKVRTEQITALPTGATPIETDMNLDADIGLVKLNVNLKRDTGGPTMAWASTLAPYKGTKLGQYCEKFGFYYGDNSDVPDTFFERSVLRFPREWIGPRLEQLKHDPAVWLSQNDLEKYRDQNAELRRHFNFFCLMPEGHKLAKSYLTSQEPFSYERLGKETLYHLQSLSTLDSRVTGLLEQIKEIETELNLQKRSSNNEYYISLNGEMESLIPMFASLPKGNLAMHRAARYAFNKGGELTPNTLSTAIRHHLYEEVLYDTGKDKGKDRMLFNERYPAKV